MESSDLKLNSNSSTSNFIERASLTMSHHKLTIREQVWDAESSLDATCSCTNSHAHRLNSHEFVIKGLFFCSLPSNNGTQALLIRDR